MADIMNTITTKSYLRGHEIEFLNGEFIYTDTKKPTISTYETRPCGHCDMAQTSEGHDGCLGALKGIMNACCGHGHVGDSYVQLLDGHTIHGDDANAILNVLKNNN